MYKEIISRHRNLHKSQRDAVLDDCAKIVMYDLGYRDAKNYEEIMKTYEPNVMKYFNTGVGLDKVFT
jgi:hypothetical protein